MRGRRVPPVDVELGNRHTRAVARASARLQVAFDVEDSSRTIELAPIVGRFASRVEVGTPLIYRFGVQLVRQVRRACPDLVVDAGEYEAGIAFEAGADVVTVLGCADDATVRGSLAAARAHRRMVMVDLLGVADPVRRARELAALGVDELCVHTGVDRQARGDDPLTSLRRVRDAVEVPLAVAGGIGMATIGAVLEAGADIVVVGRSVTQAADPPAAARALAATLHAG
jgi:3-hexulose-6-phosphate synthase